MYEFVEFTTECNVEFTTELRIRVCICSIFSRFGDHRGKECLKVDSGLGDEVIPYYGYGVGAGDGGVLRAGPNTSGLGLTWGAKSCEKLKT